MKYLQSISLLAACVTISHVALWEGSWEYWFLWQQQGLGNKKYLILNFEMINVSKSHLFRRISDVSILILLSYLFYIYVMCRTVAPISNANNDRKNLYLHTYLYIPLQVLSHKAHKNHSTSVWVKTNKSNWETVINAVRSCLTSSTSFIKMPGCVTNYNYHYSSIYTTSISDWICYFPFAEQMKNTTR